MSAARMKLPSILATIIGAGFVLLSWSQTWFELVIEASTAAGAGEAIAVGGGVASPALAALGLAGLAVAPAIAIAGPGIRIVLGMLEIVLGGCVLLAAGLTLADPVSAVSAAVTEATGVAGAAPTAELVASVAATFWPTLALVGGVILVLGGLVVLVTGSRWPASSRRYSSARLSADRPAADVERPASDRAIDDWDGLSRGDDPTDDARSTSGATGPADDDGEPTADESPSGANR
ncbi:Trp biosynthesis-associated membrane protein [Agromyces badenianii]|uniref:Trp biosynthesis-associated membrane protein n=1 Tax=Agromyces badenianii TaxID=2080742 RepID=UPI000D59DCB2|nr:Trp biosynthesis-associated membrane protein [Agromyces badenianii]PWC04084.1 hypothetical protein DCE94_07900 [Agromyces badenianii]